MTIRNDTLYIFIKSFLEIHDFPAKKNKDDRWEADERAIKKWIMENEEEPETKKPSRKKQKKVKNIKDATAKTNKV